MVEDKKVAWNASQGIIMELSNRRSQANTFFIMGDIRRAFNTLISIKQSIIQSFNDEERNILQDIEKKFGIINTALSKGNAHSFNPQVRETYQSAISIASGIYSKYNDTLMDLLEKYGYLIGEQTDASKMSF